MKRVVASLLLCLSGIVANGQTTALYQLSPKVGSLTTFANTTAPNVTASSSPIFSFFTSNSSPCSFSPSRSFTDTNTFYKKDLSTSGKQLVFSIYPTSTAYKLVIKNIKLKISSNVANVKYRLVFVPSSLPDSYSYYSEEFTANVVSSCNSNLVANTPEQTCNYPKEILGTDVIDNINRLKIDIIFYNAPSGADIRVSNITVNGCVLSSNAKVDCLGSTIQECLYTGNAVPYQNYKLAFADEFEGKSYDENHWMPRTYGGFGGTMTTKNIVQSNGLLYLKYTFDTVPSSTIANAFDSVYYGAGISTAHNLKYGYFEVKCKLYNGGKGFHQSFWQIGSSPTRAMTLAELATPVNAMQTQGFEFDSDLGSTKLQPSIWTLKNTKDQTEDRNQGGNSNGFGYVTHIKDIATSTQFFTCGFEVTPDSLRFYFNGKLRFTYPYVYPYNRDVVAIATQLSALPVPEGYYGSPITLPQPNAAMEVDYFRYYAPKSGVGINFLSNYIFGDAWLVTPGLINKPNSWINPTKTDILGRPLSFNSGAANQDSLEGMPDAPNAFNIPANKWSMKHYAVSAYRTATRQILEYIPNGSYQFSAYVKCSNKVGDSVLLRVKSRNHNNTSDTVYQISANNFSGVADASWRKVALNNVPVMDGFATVEFYSSAAANSYTYFDSAMFVGVSDTIITVNKKACLNGSIVLTAKSDIPTSVAANTTYRWQVSTFSNNGYNAWSNLSTGPTGTNSTNGFGAFYSGVTNDSLVITNINTKLRKARYRCLMTTAATTIESEYIRSSDVYQIDSITAPINLGLSTNSPAYLGATVQLNAQITGGSGSYNTYVWSGPNNFSDSSVFSYISNMSLNKNGNYVLTVTDSEGCIVSSTLPINITATANNPFTVNATATNNIIAYTNLQLNAAVLGRSGSFTYKWIGPNGFSSSLQNPIRNSVLVKDAGTYVVMVTDNVDGYIANDTVVVNVTKRTQTISFNAMSNLSNFTTSTSVNLTATASSGLPINFSSSNTALAALPTTTTLGFGRTRNDYSITPSNAITSTKFRLYSTQAAHFHIRELRLYPPNANGYPTDVYADGGEKAFSGLSNLALQATVTASGQYALGGAYMPKNAIDSLVSTSWISQQNGTSPSEKWLQFDFPTAVTVGNIQFVSGFFSGGTWQSPVTLWRLEYWNGNAWVNVSDCTVKITALQVGDENTLPAKAEQLLCVNTTNRTVTNQTNTLPVDILSFSVAEKNNIATLNWSVANEVNVAFYELQRSVDGFLWLPIMQVNTNTSNQYTVIDYNAFVTSNKVFYRLRVVDKDGGFNYSEVRSISVGLDEYKVKIYPNPVTDILQLNIPNYLLVSAPIQITVFDLLGKKRLEQRLTNTATTIITSSLQAGWYVLDVQMSSQHFKCKFLKQ